ncbi:hypothetical protein CNMCM8980_004848 [Aspergillus fumigatiaffinis]|nr:hypothetical protein CNMCM8980_004848 [Aspergillus fumigatiaffinis]
MSTTTTATITPVNSLVLEATNLRSPEYARPKSPESHVINGLVIVGLPTITKDLQLPPSLSFWPSSVNSLATASTLLLAGSLADTVGPRWVELVGSFASGALMIGQGVARTGQEKKPQCRFLVLGVSQPLGFSLGLVVGGVLVDTIGWRSGWFLSGGITLVFSIAGLWALPRSKTTQYSDLLHNIRTKIDWVGAGLASAFMALLCYLLAILSADPLRIKSADSIVMLCLAALALPSFIGWVHYQVKRNKTALIPNALWKNIAFSSICATLAISTTVVNSMELFASLFFQEVQDLSALDASVRILPSLIVGVLLNLVIGVFVHKVPAFWIATVTSLLCAGSPLLMAVIQPSWPYWGNAFVTQLLQAVSFNALYTIGLIIITNSFPDDTQALAGAVFNTAAQFGSALGLAILQVISTVVTEESGADETGALMAGYRASFWTMFGFMILCTLLGYFGLRKAGKVGLKRD